MCRIASAAHAISCTTAALARWVMNIDREVYQQPETHSDNVLLGGSKKKLQLAVYILAQPQQSPSTHLFVFCKKYLIVFCLFPI